MNSTVPTDRKKRKAPEETTTDQHTDKIGWEKELTKTKKKLAEMEARAKAAEDRATLAEDRAKTAEALVETLKAQ